MIQFRKGQQVSWSLKLFQEVLLTSPVRRRIVIFRYILRTTSRYQSSLDREWNYQLQNKAAWSRIAGRSCLEAVGSEKRENSKIFQFRVLWSGKSQLYEPDNGLIFILIDINQIRFYQKFIKNNYLFILKYIS